VQSVAGVTFHSLSAIVGIARPRLSRLLKKLGEIPAGASEIESGNMVFEAEKTVPLVRAVKTAVSLHDVAEYIGASKRQVESLYRKGIIRPLFPQKRSRIGSPGRFCPGTPRQPPTVDL
jgi:hypothetical protein